MSKMGVAYVTQHLSDAPGHKARLELSERGILCIYRVAEASGFMAQAKRALPTLFADARCAHRRLP